MNTIKIQIASNRVKRRGNVIPFHPLTVFPGETLSLQSGDDTGGNRDVVISSSDGSDSQFDSSDQVRIKNRIANATNGAISKHGGPKFELCPVF